MNDEDLKYRKEKEISFKNAVENNDLETAKSLYTNYVSVDYIEELMNDYICDNKIENIKFIINLGFNINSDLSLVNSAVIKCNFEILKYFIEECNLDVNYEKNYMLIKLSRTLFNKFNRSYERNTAYKHKKEIRKFIQYIIDKGADIHVRYETPLYNAIDKNHLELVKLLIKNGADFNNLDPLESTILKDVAFERNYNMFEYLVSIGMDIHVDYESILKIVLINKDRYKEKTLLKFLKLIMLNNPDLNENKDILSENIEILNKVNLEIRKDKLKNIL